MQSYLKTKNKKTTKYNYYENATINYYNAAGSVMASSSTG